MAQFLVEIKVLEAATATCIDSTVPQQGLDGDGQLISKYQWSPIGL